MEAKKFRIIRISQNEVKIFEYIKENYDFIMFAISKKEEIEIMKLSNVFNFKNGAKIIRRDENGIMQRIENETVDWKRNRPLDRTS